MNQSSFLQPPDRQRVDEQIAAQIADAILDGAFPPGSTLPPERDLAEQLGVNRTSLRQGLARLQQMGLVEARQGSGTVVRDPQLGLTILDPSTRVTLWSLVEHIQPAGVGACSHRPSPGRTVDTWAR